MKEFEYNVDFVLPDGLDKFKESNIASLGSSILFENTIPGVFLFCDNHYLAKAGIRMKESTVPPEYKVRMLKMGSNPNQLIYLFEIELIYKNGFSTRIHFNPREKSFRDFCSLGVRSKMISIHYFPIHSTLMSSVHLELDDDNLEWFRRNIIVSNQIKFNSSYLVISDYMKKEFPNSEYFIQMKKSVFLDVHKNKS